MKFVLEICAVLLLAARHGQALQCKVCDEGSQSGSYGTFERDDTSYSKFHLRETVCKDDTPLTTCEEDYDVCVKYDIIYDTTVAWYSNSNSKY